LRKFIDIYAENTTLVNSQIERFRFTLEDNETELSEFHGNLSSRSKCVSLFGYDVRCMAT